MTLLATILESLGPIPQTTTWKQLNAITNSISCDFNKSAMRYVVRQLLPMTAGFAKDIFRTPQMTARPWSRLLALQRTFQDSTNDSTTMDGSRSCGKTLKSPNKFSKDPKDCTTSFSLQRLTYQAASIGSYDEGCGTDNEISVR
jgi:hypothetical protein